MNGSFITIEGGEGAGKSTVLDAVRDLLASRRLDVVVTREPGGTAFGEAVRRLVLAPEFTGVCAESELLLMFAARAQLVREVVAPALAAGRWVLSDRFTDASFAYQGGGRGQPAERIAGLEAWVAGSIRPDLTLLLDVDVAAGRERTLGRGSTDRIEREDPAFFERVRRAYLARAAAEPRRFRVVDAGRPPAAVREDVLRAVAQFLTGRGVTA